MTSDVLHTVNFNYSPIFYNTTVKLTFMFLLCSYNSLLTLSDKQYCLLLLTFQSTRDRYLFLRL